MSDDMNIDLLKSKIEASIKVKQQLLEDESLLDQILDISKSCLSSLRAGGKIIFCGNKIFGATISNSRNQKDVY